LPDATISPKANPNSQTPGVLLRGGDPAVFVESQWVRHASCADYGAGESRPVGFFNPLISCEYLTN
jgi:hypothetical protein